MQGSFRVDTEHVVYVLLERLPQLLSPRGREHLNSLDFLRNQVVLGKSEIWVENAADVVLCG